MEYIGKASIIFLVYVFIVGMAHPSDTKWVKYWQSKDKTIMVFTQPVMNEDGDLYIEVACPEGWNEPRLVKNEDKFRLYCPGNNWRMTW